jgi:carnosine N-methyltransferase
MLASPPFSLLDNLNAVDDAIDCNADIAEEILALGLHSFGLPEDPKKGSDLYWHDAAKPGDLVKAHSTIRQFYRDWSEDGAAETAILTFTVLADLESALESGSTKQAIASVLVPGAGLARLVFDLSLAGYQVEGNEISYHQLLASNWILNHTLQANQFKLFPFATTFTNLRSRSHQLKEVTIPDIHPGTAMAEKLAAGLALGEMSMSAGDFITVYSALEYSGKFDAVVTVFFIDTAPNLIRYVQTVQNCLNTGGVWINIGPLLWHFDDRVPDHQEKQHGQDNSHNHNRSFDGRKEDTGIAEPGSFELSDEEVVHLVEKAGFKMIKHEIMHEGVGYIQDPQSLFQNLYMVSHWVARKTG